MYSVEGTGGGGGGGVEGEGEGGEGGGVVFFFGLFIFSVRSATSCIASSNVLSDLGVGHVGVGSVYPPPL